MATLLITKKRRSLRSLWAKFDQHLFPLIDRGVVLAISGGPDSRALLEALATWPKRNYGNFVVAIVDHGVRKEALIEARFIALRAKRLGLDAYYETLPNFGAFYGEHDLRLARYRALTLIAKRHSCNTICTAHHKDDDAEGFFMALMGVGGSEGGASMKEIEEIDGLFLCRPFLSLSKRDLLLSLSLQGITDFVRDSLDEARVGQRAYVRHEIFPYLFRMAPLMEERLSIFGKAQRRKQSVIDKLAKSLIIWHDDHAELKQEMLNDFEIAACAIWQVVKKMSNGKDLRACKPTIDKLAQELVEVDNIAKQGRPGLDPISQGFNLKPLDTKEFQFPGVAIFKGPRSVVIRPV